jgi:hypothetical protein
VRWKRLEDALAGRAPVPSRREEHPPGDPSAQLIETLKSARLLERSCADAVKTRRSSRMMVKSTTTSGDVFAIVHLVKGCPTVIGIITPPTTTLLTRRCRPPGFGDRSKVHGPERPRAGIN